MTTKAAYCEVLIKGKNRDITDYVESFNFKQSSKKDNVLELKIKVALAKEMVDDPDIIVGGYLEFRFGYMAGAKSDWHIGRIVECDPKYTSRVSLSIKANDQGCVMRKNNPQSVFNGKTSSQIAIEIAKRNGLKAVVDQTTMVHESYPQAGKNDLEFLQTLAAEEPGFVCYTESNILYFKKRSLSSKSKYKLVWMGDGGNLESFEPKFEEQQQTPESSGGAGSIIDPTTMEETKNEPKNNDTGTGEKFFNYDANAMQIPGEDKIDPKAFETQKPVVIPGTPTMQTQKADAMKSNAALKILTATFKCPGVPYLKPDDMVTVEGISKKYSGNWYIEEIAHDVPGMGIYTTSGKLTRNSSNGSINKNNGEKPKEVNTSKGQSSETKKANVYEYDANSNQLNPKK